MSDTGVWKPNTRYRVKKDWLANGDEQYSFITNHNATAAIIFKANKKHPKDELINISNYIFNAFDEIKTTKNHLPNWW